MYQDKTKWISCPHIDQLLVPFRMQMPEQVPSGHKHHCNWEVLRGDASQSLQRTPCFSVKHKNLELK